MRVCDPHLAVFSKRYYFKDSIGHNSTNKVTTKVKKKISHKITIDQNLLIMYLPIAKIAPDNVNIMFHPNTYKRAQKSNKIKSIPR